MWRWGFWQISGWYGKWSKVHLIKDGWTRCGRQANPEIGSRVVFTDKHPPDRCKRCVHLENK